ncbi:chloramphenicol acetyltransferase [Aquimarina sp. TRL1]|uniref:chloramphenicol acetyltransferase n=1 Tax=Aquimarina sp. (strain TRL1) TaxID=2736252 RepID=UPI0015897A33|nr:chloramphenicol acetyltransferase [Aquimarina sp. TRL1]QKX06617.1 chloramphenicol acetyltransferase [Aquimarina sp. TRL1]
MKIIDISTWKRKEHFEFYKSFDEPFFGLVSEVDCSKAYRYSKNTKSSFYALYLHASISAINEIEEFKCRINEQGTPVYYDTIHAGSVIARNNGTFAFGFIPYDTDLNRFSNSLQKEIKAVHNSEGMRLNKETSRIDMIHYSAIPWSTFSGLTHARNFSVRDSIPKITFGKTYIKDTKVMMPVAVNLHHGLGDGLHIGMFLESFQNHLNLYT